MVIVVRIGARCVYVCEGGGGTGDKGLLCRSPQKEALKKEFIYVSNFVRLRLRKIREKNFWQKK